jgi:IMP dehydrogenase
MKFLNGLQPPYDLTYSDVFMTPAYTEVESRFNVDLRTPDGACTIPLVVANMTAVAGKRMAETVARRGGIAVLPQDIPYDALEEMISYIKSRHTVLETPITLAPDETIADAMSLIYKRSHGAVVITDDKQKPLGIFTEQDAGGLDQFTRLRDAMSTVLFTLPESLTPEEMFDELHRQRLSVAPVVSKNGKLAGVITLKGALRTTLYQPALDARNRLKVAVAIGINGDVAKKTETVIGLGADIIVVDTAHGHQAKMIAALKAVRSVSKDAVVVAGNVVTAEATEALIKAGADIIKVGVGPGAMCTTRMMTGVGRPQFSAVLECSTAARTLGKHVWADGGVRHPRDVALALAAGASNVMFASWLAGTYESAGDMLRDTSGRLYKESYGMASNRAVKFRNRQEAALGRARKELFEEGISNSKLYVDTERPGVEDIIDYIMAGVRSAATYAGASTIDEFHERAVIGIQSAAGYQEGKPLPTSW